MKIEKIDKSWLEKYYGIKVVGKYLSFWMTDGGRGTWDFDRLDFNKYEIIHRSNSKTIWGRS